MKSQIPIAAKPLAVAPNGSLPPGAHLVPIAVGSINPAGQQIGQQASGAAGIKPNTGKTGKTTKAEAKAAAAAAAQQQATNSSHMMNGSMHNHHHNHQPVNNSSSNNVNDPIALLAALKQQQQQQQQGFMQPGQQFYHVLPITTNMVRYSEIKYIKIKE